jgi:hypothetical protein
VAQVETPTHVLRWFHDAGRRSFAALRITTRFGKVLVVLTNAIGRC